MKRNNYGEAKIVAYVTGEYKPIYVLSDDSVKYWKDLKGDFNDYIALAFESKIYFRRLYWRSKRGFGFKFLNRFIYLDECFIMSASIVNGVVNE